MGNFAVIRDNVVVNTIIVDNKELAEELTGQLCVEYFDENPAVIGYGFDGTTFEQPPVIEYVEENSESAE